MWALGVPFPYPEGKPWSASWEQRVSELPMLDVGCGEGACVRACVRACVWGGGGGWGGT
jgi:hypothetical protein